MEFASPKGNLKINGVIHQVGNNFAVEGKKKSKQNPEISRFRGFNQLMGFVKPLGIF